MTKQIRCKDDLGVTGCTFVAEGEAPGQIIQQVADHLRDKHSIDLPPTNVILKGTERTPELNKAVALIIERLRTKLNLSPPTEPVMKQTPIAPPLDRNQ
jgi:predicted small metal-binding protein